jgi:tRNA (cytidine32/uridine32-2'-O)-methyltransferase
VEDLLGAVRVVLCRPRNPQNLGAAARALRCAGISRWAVVDPQTSDLETARRVAVHAEDLLDQRQVCTNLPEAIVGCTLTVGTTARVRPDRPLLSPKEAAERLIGARGPVALVFGDERSGLTAEEIEAVDLVTTIPSAPEQPSWNLAQAIAIYSWELRSAAMRGQFVQTARSVQTAPDALASVDRALAEATASLGKPALRRKLYKALERAALSPREATLWTAFLRAVGRSR